MSDYTHAGGIVYRVVDGRPEYLVITAKENAAHWVLPKGHIEAGESPEAAAIREVREETGIDASTADPVGTIEFELGGESVRSVFYLMRADAAHDDAENRRQRWCRYDEALDLMTFDDSRDLVVRANRLLSEA